MTIKAYLKPQCGWSNGVRAILRKHNLPFEDIDIINNRANYAEMVQKSGQPLSPCVEIDGVMLADVSGEEVENRSEEHTSELQSLAYLVCRLLLEKKKKKK